MQRLIPLVVSLVVIWFAGIASAQTTTQIPAGQSCVTNFFDCYLHDSTGAEVATWPQYSYVTNKWAGWVLYGHYPNTHVFYDNVQYPVLNPVDPDPADNHPILLAVEFADPQGTTYTLVLKGYPWHACGSGRSGCHSGLTVSSGSLTIR